MATLQEGHENVLHGMGRVIGSMRGGITLQIEKKSETAGELKEKHLLYHECPVEHSEWSILFCHAL